MTEPAGRLHGKRILITSADTYMGPAIAELFGREDAELVLAEGPLDDPAAPAALLAAYLLARWVARGATVVATASPPAVAEASLPH